MVRRIEGGREHLVKMNRRRKVFGKKDGRRKITFGKKEGKIKGTFGKKEGCKNVLLRLSVQTDKRTGSSQVNSR